MEASGYHSGIKIALGHTIVELPLIILLALSIFEYSSFTLTEESLRVIGLIGGNTLQHESFFYHLVANGRIKANI
jgi:hypothetical protein